MKGGVDFDTQSFIYIPDINIPNIRRNILLKKVNNLMK